MEENSNGQETSDERQGPNWPESNLPAKNPGRFTADNQPSGAQKSLGWWKKRRGRKMIRALMQLQFDGDIIDPNTKQVVTSEVKKAAAIYFGLPEGLITVEMVMAMRQIGLAIQRGDTNAFNSAWEKAYGKPKEIDDEDTEGIGPPVINIYLGDQPDFPEIKENEHDEKETD